MQPTHPRSPRPRTLHGFDARSLVLFASLTMGGTQAILAQDSAPSPEPRSTTSAPASQRAALTAEQAFERADTNRDGKLTWHEAERFPAVAERFRQLDTDQNGSLARAEFAEGLKQR